MQLTSNLFTIVCGLVALWFSWRIYRVMRAPSVLVLSLAIVWLVFLRAAVTLDNVFWPSGPFISHSQYWLVPFWPLLATAKFLLYRALRGPWNGNHVPDSKEAP